MCLIELIKSRMAEKFSSPTSTNIHTRECRDAEQKLQTKIVSKLFNQRGWKGWKLTCYLQRRIPASHHSQLIFRLTPVHAAIVFNSLVRMVKEKKMLQSFQDEF